jgi:hypothetical protein
MEPTFSLAMQSRLKKSATVGGMTDVKALALFENFIQNDENAFKNSENNDCYTFKIPNEIKFSENRIKYISTIMRNLIACYFKQTDKPAFSNLSQGEFQFISFSTPKHQCNLGCQREGCPQSYDACNYDDKNIYQIKLCM